MKQKEYGQALVALLFFVIVALTFTSAAVSLMVINAQAGMMVEAGATAKGLTESGAENALLRLLRMPTYTGETLTIATGSVTVGVTGGDTKTIVSRGTIGNVTRTVQVIVSFVNGIWTIASWKEVF